MSLPKMVFADAQGQIYDHPTLDMCGMAGPGVRPIQEEDLIPLPEGSDVFTLPGRAPIGWDTETDEAICFDEMDGEPVFGVGAFMAPAHTQILRPAYERQKGSPALPTYAYTAIGFRDDQFWVAGLRVDSDMRQDPYRFDLVQLEENVSKRMADQGDNRVISQISRCALEYGCRAAQNFYLNRWEAPLPVSVACNAQCIGCISLQPDGEFKAAHDRLDVAPTAEEIAQVALDHIGRTPQAVVSYGQGCEGEPLLMGELLIESTRLIRKATEDGTVNLNSNGSRPDIVEAMVAEGLDSIRVSMNSPRPDLYRSYYQPRGYDVSNVIKSLKVVNRAGGFTAINLFVFPGVTDTEAELEAISELIEDTGLEMIQLRNLNIDPELYARVIPAGTLAEGMGIHHWMQFLQDRFPHLQYGYFNPPKERFQSWRAGEEHPGYQESLHA